MTGKSSGTEGAPAFDVLRRIREGRPAAPPGERCDMCAVPIAAEHSHVVDVQGRQLMCVCRPCYLLFTDEHAHLRFRAVPDRYLRFGAGAITAAEWNALDIPVGLAFFFRNSVLGRVVTFYPGPAGATESQLPLEDWERFTLAIPPLRTMLDDVEALLIRAPESSANTADGPESYLVPIDACYELVGHLRAVWRGFDGGQEARARIADFFTRIAARSKNTEPDRAGGLP
ncbi:DUF5947 family protein [Hoyosella sp. YIM 151337]|uniref:DUF5947 family protein n=1 Tax=Hoyosella sp. YIM 151337 TaxID=2992742 RepID=UPI00223638C5|nr:DUF5947 family protein [Hoyosella sp. YIM 151337]MCW4353100.1 DUF5947 family protein [Hoyosella sp. YIM 151337]